MHEEQFHNTGRRVRSADAAVFRAVEHEAALEKKAERREVRTPVRAPVRQPQVRTPKIDPVRENGRLETAKRTVPSGTAKRQAPVTDKRTQARPRNADDCKRSQILRDP